jgi:hypothetical protein
MASSTRCSSSLRDSGAVDSCHGTIVVISDRDHDFACALDQGAPGDRGGRRQLRHVLRIAPPWLCAAGDDGHLPDSLWPIRCGVHDRARSVERRACREPWPACPFPACDRRTRDSARSAGRSDQRSDTANAGPPRVSHRIWDLLWRRRHRLCSPLPIQSRRCSRACPTTLPTWADRHTCPTGQANKGGLKSGGLKRLSGLGVAVRNGGMHVEVGRPMRLRRAPIQRGARLGCRRLRAWQDEALATCRPSIRYYPRGC